MIITKTPFRISFFGGGTDIENFFKIHGGSVLASTIDKYCYVNVRHLPRFFDYTNEFCYSEIEQVTSIDSIKHPAIRNAMKLLDMHEIRLSYDADLPARSGLGTSSSFAVGMLQAFYALKGKYIDKKKLAKDAIYLERKLCNEAGGWQDQVSASYGGLNRINFDQDGFEVVPIIISPERKRELNRNLMLFFSGFTRISSDVHKSNDIIASSNIENLIKMRSLVDEGECILQNTDRDLDCFGKLLDKAWGLKRTMGHMISNCKIDSLYERAKSAGALGGKLLGAGGGGFFLFYVRIENQSSVKNALSDLMYVPFEFENYGSQVIYYTPEMFPLK